MREEASLLPRPHLVGGVWGQDYEEASYLTHMTMRYVLHTLYHGYFWFKT